MDLGCFTAVQHEIDTGDAKPVCQRMRHKPLGFAEERRKVFEEDARQWCHPTFKL